MQKILNDARTKNPYPEDVFIEPSEEEYARVQEIFKNAGLIQDKFFGAYGRKVWDNCIDVIEQMITKREN